MLNARKQFALPAPSIMAFPSTTGTQLALSASTSHSFTEPVVVSVHQSAYGIKYLEGICLKEFFDDVVFNSNTNVSHSYANKSKESYDF